LPDGSTAVSAALRYPETQSVEEFNHQSKFSSLRLGQMIADLRSAPQLGQ